jgi:hypothetical protein
MMNKSTSVLTIEKAAMIFRVKKGNSTEEDRREVTIGEAESYREAETFTEFVNVNGLILVEEVQR